MYANCLWGAFTQYINSSVSSSLHIACIRHRKERNSCLSWHARDAAAERDSAQSEREEPSGSVEFFMSRVTNRNYNERGGREAKKAVCLRWKIRKYFHTFNGVCDIMCNETRFSYLHPLLTCDNKLLVSLFCNTLCSPDLMDNYRVVWRESENRSWIN